MIKKNILTFLPVLMLLGSSFYGCSDWDDHYGLDDHSNEDIYTILDQLEHHPKLLSDLEKTGYDKVLQGNEMYTVLIPEESVWNTENLSDDELKTVVGHHILFGRYFTNHIEDTFKVQALSGKFFDVYPAQDNGFTLSYRTGTIEPYIGTSNIHGSNGAAHTVNAMLPTVKNLREFIDNELNANEYSIFINEYNRLDTIHPEMAELRLGLNEYGEVVRDTLPYWVYSTFNPGDEAIDRTVLIPSDASILEQREMLVNMNGGDESKISDSYYSRLIRNHVLKGAYNREQLFNADTILTEGLQKVVGNKMQYLGEPQIASNGYAFVSDVNLYKPIAADFIDSLVYEAEWSLGIDNHERTLVYTSQYEPQVGGDDVYINKHLFAGNLYSGNRVGFFIPDVPNGLYQVKMAYLQSDIIVNVNSEGRTINEEINLETIVPADPNNPNEFAYIEIGFVNHPDDGYLHLDFLMTRASFGQLKLDKIVLVPVEY